MSGTPQGGFAWIPCVGGGAKVPPNGLEGVGHGVGYGLDVAPGDPADGLAHGSGPPTSVFGFENGENVALLEAELIWIGGLIIV